MLQWLDQFAEFTEFNEIDFIQEKLHRWKLNPYCSQKNIKSLFFPFPTPRRNTLAYPEMHNTNTVIGQKQNINNILESCPITN